MVASVNTQYTGGTGKEQGAVLVTAAKVMTNGDVIFTAAGNVQILDLISNCTTPNGAALTTLQYSITPTVGSATAISGVTSSLASAVAGTNICLVGDALATAPVVAPSGVALSQTARGVFFPAGTLTLVIAVGPTTGTWKHYLRYAALEPGAYVY